MRKRNSPYVIVCRIRNMTMVMFLRDLKKGKAFSRSSSQNKLENK